MAVQFVGRAQVLPCKGNMSLDTFGVERFQCFPETTLILTLQLVISLAIDRFGLLRAGLAVRLCSACTFCGSCLPSFICSFVPSFHSSSTLISPSLPFPSPPPTKRKTHTDPSSTRFHQALTQPTSYACSNQ